MRFYFLSSIIAMKLIKLAQRRETTHVISETSALLREWKKELTHQAKQYEAVKSFVSFVVQTTSLEEREWICHHNGSQELHDVVTQLIGANVLQRATQLATMCFSPQGMRIPLLMMIFVKQYNLATTYEQYDDLANEYYHRLTKEFLLSKKGTTPLRIPALLQKNPSFAHAH